jgi:hypothetical protein
MMCNDQFDYITKSFEDILSGCRKDIACQFDYITKSFEDTLSGCRKDIACGRARPTPAGRVRDIAMFWQELSESEAGRTLCGWYLAVAIERLMALEAAGIPT